MLAKFPKKTADTGQEPAAADLPASDDANPSRVVMYTTTWCGDCKAAKRYFADKGVSYEEIDIERVPGAAEKVMAWANGTKTVPTMVIGNEVVVDWQRKLVERALVSEGIISAD